MSLEQMVYQFLLRKSRSNEWSINTFKAYENDLKHWLFFMHDCAIFELSSTVSKTTSCYIQKLFDARFSHATIQRKRKVLNLFNEFCLLEFGHAIQEENYEIKNLSPITHKYSDKTMIDLLYSLGLNEEEIISIAPSNINTNTGIIHLNKKYYMIPNNELLSVNEWLRTKDQNALLFPYNKKAIKALLKHRSHELSITQENTPLFIPDYRLNHPRG